MTIKTVKADLLKAPCNYYIAHCVSADFKLGAGVARQINEAYNMSDKLKEFYPDDYMNKTSIGRALLVDNVFNLVTKERYYHKPTLSNLLVSLINMRTLIEKLHVKKLAIPRLGCGLDKLNWDDVYQLIQDVFKDTDIDITVCVLV